MQHGDAVVSTVVSQQEDLEFESAALPEPFCMWLHVLPMRVFDLSGNSSFFPQSTGMHVSLN